VTTTVKQIAMHSKEYDSSANQIFYSPDG